MTAQPIVWIVGGAADDGPAGIAADRHTLEAFDVRGCHIAAAASTDALEARLAALAPDMPPAAIKAGGLGSAAHVGALARVVDRLRERQPRLPLVIDAALPAVTGALGDDELIKAYRRELLPRTTLAMPDREQAARLLGWSALVTEADVQAAARALCELGCESVVVRSPGGDDYVLTPHARGWLTLERIDALQHRGASSVFTSSAAAALALGFVSTEATVLAKMAAADALRQAATEPDPGRLAPAPGFALKANNLPSFWIPGQERKPWSFAPMPEARIGLYAIVDSADWVERVVAAGARTVQLRIKTPSNTDLREQIATAVRIARRHGAQLFVNDHWPLAIACGADGVHLGQEDLAEADLGAIARAGLRLGVSTHSYWEVCRAWALKPSYIACGPIHATYAKQMPWTPQGHANLAYWCALLPIPVVAIGGMDVVRARQAAECGAAAVAVISAITAAEDPQRAVAALMAAVTVAASSQQGPALARPTLIRS